MLKQIKRALRIFPPAYRLASAFYRATVGRAAKSLQHRREIAAWRDAGRLVPPTQSAEEQRREIASWQEGGRPVPPPASVKQAIVAAYGERFGIRTLVETGTYLGQMVEAQRGRFDRVWSIELDKTLARTARERFKDAKNVAILHGDSGKRLKEVLSASNGPCLFWLDAHYSGEITVRGETDTPIRRELEVVLTGPWEHVILIDDARELGSGDYPSLDEIRSIVASHRHDWAVWVKDDIIRVHSGAPWTPPSP